MKIRRSCEVSNINWGALPDLQTRLGRLGVVVKSVSVEVTHYPDTVTYDSFQDATNDMKRSDIPTKFVIRVHGLLEGKDFSLAISRGRNIHDEKYLYVDCEGSKVYDGLESVMQFLGLKPDVPSTLPPKPSQTAFIGHRFDSAGKDASDKVARFLELTGFRVVTGRAHSPKSIAEKVRARVEEQALVFVVLTPGSDDAWLIQESILGDIKGKPLFILKDTSVDFKSGLLADREYIPFIFPHVETCFIPILEGLKELGYYDADS